MMRNRYPQITQMTQINFSRRGAEALRTEDGGQRTEDRQQMTEDRRWMTKDRGQKSENKGKDSGI